LHIMTSQYSVSAYPAVIRIPRVSLKDIKKVVSSKFCISRNQSSIMDAKFDTIRNNLKMIRNLLAGPLFMEPIKPGASLDHNGFFSGEKIMLDGNKWAGRKTSCGFYINSDIKSVYSVFKQLAPFAGKSFVDLGSGMGDIVFIAKLFGIKKAVGYENDLFMLLISRFIQRKMSSLLPEMGDCIFTRGSYIGEVHLSEYDVSYIYPDNAENLNIIVRRFAVEARSGSLLMINSGHLLSDNFSKYYSVSVFGDIAVLRRNSLPFLS
jgi:hypothetical protein